MKPFNRRTLLCASLVLACAQARAVDTPDQAQVRQLLMHTFDKPGARLAVDPIVVQGTHALAGWSQGERGGRAVLRRHGKDWAITVCGGDGLKDAKVLMDTGIPASEAKALAQALAAAESRLTAAQRARFSTFDGLLRMDAQGQHPH